MSLTMLAVAWLLTYLIHSTILLGGAWALSWSGVVRSAAAREVLWKVALVGGLLTASVQSLSPMAPFPGRYWLPGAGGGQAAEEQASPLVADVPAARPVRSRATADPTHPAPATTSVATITSHSSRITLAPRPSPITHRASLITWPRLLLGVWIFGALALLARVVICRQRVSRYLGGRRDVESGPLADTLRSVMVASGVRRTVRLTVGEGVSGPLAIGRGEICLPARALTSLSPAEQRAVLAHELGHLVRRDPVWLGLAVAIESALFLQPLNRLARHRMQDAAEYLCDDWAVHHSDGSLTLAKCLAEVATWIVPVALPVSGMAESRSQLVERVQRLLEGVQPRPGRGWRIAAPLAAVALAAMAFTAPGIAPPCPGDAEMGIAQGGAAAAAARTLPASPQPWATVRDGRFLLFRAGFAPRITGQGALGIRHGGRDIELLDGQRLLVDGQPAAEGTVSVCETSSLVIADADGRTLWRIEPVRLPAVGADQMAEGDVDDSMDALDARLDALHQRLDSLGLCFDSLRLVLGDVDGADIAMISGSAAELGAEIAGEVQAEVVPHVATLQGLGARLAADLAPRMARLGALVGSRVAAEISCAIDDRGLCGADSVRWSDSTLEASPPHGKKLHRRR